MRAIVSAPGSRGDVNPMIAIGAQLRRRGFDVVISLAEPYAELARERGLRAEPVIDRARFDRLLNKAAVWRPIRGARAILREVAGEFLTKHDEVIRRHHRSDQTVLVAHPLDFASRVFRDVDPATPLVDVHLAPATLRVVTEPAKLTPWWWEPSGPAWLMRATYWLTDLLIADPALAGAVNRLRAREGLPPVKRLLDQWWLSPDRILAMYPRWFAPESRQASEQLVHVGFPLEDADDGAPAAPSDRPIAFTAGTAHRHAAEFFRRAATACRQLERPGLLLSTHAENLPAELPPQVRAMGYVAFGSLLPHCAAIVHHGGIGTTAQACASGTPQLIRPMAFDQFDNTRRVEQLGCGRWLKNDRRMTAELDRLLREVSVQRACEKVAERLRDEPPAAAKAAEEIEQVIGGAGENRPTW